MLYADMHLIGLPKDNAQFVGQLNPSAKRIIKKHLYSVKAMVNLSNLVLTAVGNLVTKPPIA